MCWGVSLKGSVRPGWPGWPPDLRPDFLRKLLGLGCSGRSVEGGRELLWLVCAAESRNRRTSA